MELVDLSASDLSRMIAARQVAPSEVMAAHLTQIAAVNGAVNAVISLRDPDDLMAEARLMDDAVPTGWLHGLPFGGEGSVRHQRLAHHLGITALRRLHPAGR